MARYTGDISENVNFALKAEVARTFLDSKGIKYQMERSDKQLSPADVGDIGRPFTVHIECERAGHQSVAAVGNSSPFQVARSFSSSEVERADRLCKDSLSKKTVDAIIEACSIVIGSNSDGPKTEALLIRGAAYRIKHEYSNADQDFQAAMTWFRIAAKNGTALLWSTLLGFGHTVRDLLRVAISHEIGSRKQSPPATRKLRKSFNQGSAVNATGRAGYRNRFLTAAPRCAPLRTSSGSSRWRCGRLPMIWITPASQSLPSARRSERVGQKLEGKVIKASTATD